MNERFDQECFDLGPIAWPISGYIDENDVKGEFWAQAPSLFIYEDYIYVYYLDQDKIRVIRSNKNDILKGNSFYCCKKDGLHKILYQRDLQDIPETFSKRVLEKLTTF